MTKFKTNEEREEHRKEYSKEYYQRKGKTIRDRLFTILSNPDARLILKLMKKGEVCTYTQMFNGFSVKKMEQLY